MLEQPQNPRQPHIPDTKVLSHQLSINTTYHHNASDLNRSWEVDQSKWIIQEITNSWAMAPGLGICILTVEKTVWSTVARVTQLYNAREWRWLDSWYPWTCTFQAVTPAPTRKSLYRRWMTNALKTWSVHDDKKLWILKGCSQIKPKHFKLYEENDLNEASTGEWGQCQTSPDNMQLRIRGGCHRRLSFPAQQGTICRADAGAV